MKKSIVLSFTLALIMLMSSCGNENKIGKKIDELSSNVTSTEISNLWFSYKALEVNELDSLSDEQKDKIELMYAIDLIQNEQIKRIQDNLYRPSSLEINEISVEIYYDSDNRLRTSNGFYSSESSRSIYYIKLYIDYSAQVQAGGYNREKDTDFYVVIDPNVWHSDDYTDDDVLLFDVLTPYVPQWISEEDIEDNKVTFITYKYSNN